MTLKKLLSGTALTTSLLMAGSLSANATDIPLGGFTGQVDIIFHNYESFLVTNTTTGGQKTQQVTNAPTTGAMNFGIFTIAQIYDANHSSNVLWTPGTNGQVLVGVFNDITVTGVTGTAANEHTTNTGGVFQLYLVSQADWIAAGRDQGTTGYANAGCAVGSLCYNGITNAASSQLVLTMDLTTGVDLLGSTLVATLDATVNPPTGHASFNGLILQPSQFAPKVTGKDSFCPNAYTASNTQVTQGIVNQCAGADGKNWALASLDPMTATVVPEPSSLLAFGGGLLGLGAFGSWRRKRKRSRVAG
jgi:hypothetical protein